MYFQAWGVWVQQSRKVPVGNKRILSFRNKERTSDMAYDSVDIYYESANSAKLASLDVLEPARLLQQPALRASVESVGNVSQKLECGLIDQTWNGDGC